MSGSDAHEYKEVYVCWFITPLTSSVYLRYWSSKATLLTMRHHDVYV